MNTQVSTPVKVFAVVALLAGVLLMGGMMFLGPSADDSAADTFVPPVKPKAQSAAAPTLEPTAQKRKAAATTKPAAATTKPAAAKAKAAKPAGAKPRKRPLVDANGLPMVIADALRERPVVVLALADRGAQIDPLALAEAEAGARDAKAGFVTLDVVRDAKVAEALMLKFNVVLRSPAVYIFTRPGQVAVELSGYRDRQTVAQAALNALG